jgi:hypothetical protein
MQDAASRNIMIKIQKKLFKENDLTRFMATPLTCKTDDYSCLIDIQIQLVS